MEIAPTKLLTKRQRLLFQWGITTLILAALLAILIFTGVLNPASKTDEMSSDTQEITSVLSREASIEARFQFSPVENSGIEFSESRRQVLKAPRKRYHHFSFLLLN